MGQPDMTIRTDEFKDFAHVGPGTLAGQYLRRFWHPVHVSDDLQVGRPVRVSVLGEFFTLWRGEGGSVNLVQDRCPHRQCLLALGWVAGDNIRCFYHGWEFNGTGQCVAQPAEKTSFAAKVRIRSYPARDYLGLVFCYLGEGEPPEFRRFPELEDSAGGVTVHSHPVPCNYFQRVENDLDELHEGIRSGSGMNVSRVGNFMMPIISMVDLPPWPGHRYWT